MKVLIFLALLVAIALADICPKPSNLAGFCVFRPGYNCLDDGDCGTGKLCCPEGCGKVCKPAQVITQSDVIHSGSCPVATRRQVGICLHIPGYNCFSDDECAADERCCHQGCGQVCKKTV